MGRVVVMGRGGGGCSFSTIVVFLTYVLLFSALVLSFLLFLLDFILFLCIPEHDHTWDGVHVELLVAGNC